MNLGSSYGTAHFEFTFYYSSHERLLSSPPFRQGAVSNHSVATDSFFFVTEMRTDASGDLFVAKKLPFDASEIPFMYTEKYFKLMENLFKLML